MSQKWFNSIVFRLVSIKDRFCNELMETGDYQLWRSKNPSGRGTKIRVMSKIFQQNKIKTSKGRQKHSHHVCSKQWQSDRQCWF